ncbi:MAG: pyruvate formate lyase family protein, partial [Candidatus Zipacnadales bacterium]
MLTDRVLRLKERALRSRHLGDPQAEHLWQESLAQTEGEPEVIRQAKALAHYYRCQAVSIRDDELIVGSCVGLTADSEEEIIPTIFGRRIWGPPGDFWPVPGEAKRFWDEGLLAPAGNHTTLDYETVFAIGFMGLISRIEDRLTRCSPTD